MPRLIGDNIILREYQTDDIAAISEWKNDSGVVNNLSNTFFRNHSLKQNEEYVNHFMESKSNDLYYVIADKINLKYIRQIDITIDWINRVGSLGIVIGKETDRNKGYGTEAVKLLLEYAFNRANLNRIKLEVYSNNLPAIECYNKCGFVKEGILRSEVYREGKYADLIIMGILKTEYEDRYRKWE